MNIKSIIILISIITNCSVFSGPGGGGGNGGPGMTQPLRLLGGIVKSTEPSVFTIKDVVDVRLNDDEVLDVQEFQDRFSEDVTKVGDDLRIAKKIPIADFQNMNGEVIRIQNIELRN